MVSDFTCTTDRQCEPARRRHRCSGLMAMLFQPQEQRPPTISSPRFFVDNNVYGQTKEVLMTRAKPIHVELVLEITGPFQLDESWLAPSLPGCNQTNGDFRSFIEKSHAGNARVVMATDLMAFHSSPLPVSWGADVARGQRPALGVFAIWDSADHIRSLPPGMNSQTSGQIIRSVWMPGATRCLRMALQTETTYPPRKATEQYLARPRRFCMSAMYAVYHGAEGIRISPNAPASWRSTPARQELGFVQ